MRAPPPGAGGAEPGGRGGAGGRGAAGGGSAAERGWRIQLRQRAALRAGAERTRLHQQGHAAPPPQKSPKARPPLPTSPTGTAAAQLGAPPVRRGGSEAAAGRDRAGRGGARGREPRGGGSRREPVSEWSGWRRAGARRGVAWAERAGVGIAPGGRAGATLRGSPAPPAVATGFAGKRLARPPLSLSRRGLGAAPGPRCRLAAAARRLWPASPRGARDARGQGWGEGGRGSAGRAAEGGTRCGRCGEAGAPFPVRAVGVAHCGPPASEAKCEVERRWNSRAFTCLLLRKPLVS